MLRSSFIVLVALLGLALAKELGRSKRQTSVYYMCGSYPNSYVSQFPCSNVNYNNGCGCGYNAYNNCNCNGYNAPAIIPTSFYNPGYNCNSGCSNINCNNYNGQWINGQYVAYSYGTNQYSPCGSSCCGGGQIVQPIVGNIGNVGVPIGMGVQPNIVVGGVVDGKK